MIRPRRQCKHPSDPARPYPITQPRPPGHSDPGLARAPTAPRFRPECACPPKQSRLNRSDRVFRRHQFPIRPCVVQPGRNPARRRVVDQPVGHAEVPFVTIDDRHTGSQSSVAPLPHDNRGSAGIWRFIWGNRPDERKQTPVFNGNPLRLGKLLSLPLQGRHRRGPHRQLRRTNSWPIRTTTEQPADHQQTKARSRRAPNFSKGKKAARDRSALE